MWSPLLALFLLFTTIQLAIAQHSPKDYLDAHNAARSDASVPPVHWDKKLESYAKYYASKQAGDCLPLRKSHGPYGENIFWGPGRRFYTPMDAVDAWMAQKKYYNYHKNRCEYGKRCDNYKQMVWAKTKKIGCASTLCSGGVYMVCEYYPPGNVPGERPY